MKLRAQRLLDWAASLDQNFRRTVCESDERATSALLGASIPGWRPASLEHALVNSDSRLNDTVTGSTSHTEPFHKSSEINIGAQRPTAQEVGGTQDMPSRSGRGIADQTITCQAEHAPGTLGGDQSSTATAPIPPVPRTQETVEETGHVAATSQRAPDPPLSEPGSPVLALEDSNEDASDRDNRVGDIPIADVANRETRDSHDTDTAVEEPRIHGNEESMADLEGQGDTESGGRDEDQKQDNEGEGNEYEQSEQEEDGDEREARDGNTSSNRSEVIRTGVTEGSAPKIDEQARQAKNQARNVTNTQTQVAPAQLVSRNAESTSEANARESSKQPDGAAHRSNSSSALDERTMSDSDGDDIELAQGLSGGDVFLAGKPAKTPTSNPRDDGATSESTSISSLESGEESGPDTDQPGTPIRRSKSTQKPGKSSMKRSSRAIATIAETPSKRKKVAVELTKRLSSLAVEDVPNRLIQPPKVLQLVSEILDEPHKDSAPALTSFFYTVASPYALRRLHEACLSVRNSQTHEPFSGDVDVRHLMQALDSFEMHQQIYPILQRYYLVQLAKCKDTLQKEKLKSLSIPGTTSLKRTLRKKLRFREMREQRLQLVWRLRSS